MTILRFPPGEVVPSAGVFALVGHFGEPTGVAIWLDEGEKLPLMTVTRDIGPIWFVKVGDEISSSLAA